MFNIFDGQKLMRMAKQLHSQYVSAQPFPAIIIDNFMDEQLLQQALDQFPTPDQLDFYRYDNPLEKKLAFDQVAKLPKAIANILFAMNSPIFLRFLEELTGIDGLIPDPYYRGGGIHQIVHGGKLDVHIDFNHYTKLGLHRRLNALIYLNKNWQEEYGGHFEMWRGRYVDGKHILDECTQKVLPIFNRLVVFSTSESSYHGHPEPLNCPHEFTRKSLATYYYTAKISDEFKNTPAHSTIFIKRPTDSNDAQLEALREKRNQGRLTSNVKSEFTAD